MMNLYCYSSIKKIDISIKEDLIEEVSRIYGVDNIEGILPVVNMKSGTYDKTTRAIRSKWFL